MTATDQNIQNRPDLRALFLGFSSVGLSGFGGVLPFARRMLVDVQQWMTAEEFNAQLCSIQDGERRLEQILQLDAAAGDAAVLEE